MSGSATTAATRTDSCDCDCGEGAASAAPAVTCDEEDGFVVVDGVKHGKPTEGMMCLCTMEDITEEALNYVEFQSEPSGRWRPCLFEASIVRELLATQFSQYVERVKTTDCQAELKRLLRAGPPSHVSDKHAFPLQGGGDDEQQQDDDHVSQLWFADNPAEHVSARLHGAPALGSKERTELWEELKQFVILDGKEEGDDDDEEDQEGEK